MNEFSVTIEQFDGPLDLMLHLISEGNLDIFDLDIAKLADQYIDYIHSMQKMHLDVASDYLYELAYLIEYKSKKLLPKPTEALKDSYEGDSEEDLVKRLLEYQKYKEVSSKLEQLFTERSQMHDKPAQDISQEWIKVDENNQRGSAYDLIKAMQKCLKRFSLEQPYEVSITKKEITVDQRKEQLRAKIKFMGDSFSLEDTMKDCHDKYMVVVTFLSILDMVHEGELLFASQNDNIYFRKGAKYE